MNEIHGKSILVRVRARFELSGVDCIHHNSGIFSRRFTSCLYLEVESNIFHHWAASVLYLGCLCKNIRGWTPCHNQIAFRIGHLRVHLSLHFKARLVGSLCYEKQFSSILKLELIIITKVSQLDSLWKRDWRELGNGLFKRCPNRNTTCRWRTSTLRHVQHYNNMNNFQFWKSPTRDHHSRVLLPHIFGYLQILLSKNGYS